MSNQKRDQEMRDMVREVLRELVPGVAPQPAPARGNGQANADGRADGMGQQSGNGHGRADARGRASATGSGRAPANGSGRAPANGGGRARANGQPSGGGANVVPRVPAPPVAAVIRPSTWDRPPAPGEVIGHSQPARAAESTSRAARSAPGAGSRSRPGGPAPAGEPSLRAERLQAAFRDSDFKPATAAPRQAATYASVPPAASTAASVPASAGDDVRVEVVALDGDEDLEQFVRGLMTRLDNPRERLAIRTGRLRFSLRRSATSSSVSSGGAAAPATRVEKGAVTERMIRTAAAEGARLVLAPGAVLTPLAREQAKARGVEIERERRC